MSAHIEEGLEGVLACWVVRIDVVFVGLGTRSLDVPEDMVGDLGEDFSRSRCGQTLVEGAAHVDGVVVLLALLEGVHLAGQDLVPLLEVVASLFKGVVHSDTDFSLITSLKSLTGLHSIESSSHLVLIEFSRKLLF